MSVHAETLRIQIEEMGDQHVMTSIETPLREDAFEMDDAEKIDLIEY
jgi:GTP cyclohydrolase I